MVRSHTRVRRSADDRLRKMQELLEALENNFEPLATQISRKADESNPTGDPYTAEGYLAEYAWDVRNAARQAASILRAGIEDEKGDHGSRNFSSFRAFKRDLDKELDEIYGLLPDIRDVLSRVDIDLDDEVNKLTRIYERKVDGLHAELTRTASTGATEYPEWDSRWGRKPNRLPERGSIDIVDDLKWIRDDNEFEEAAHRGGAVISGRRRVEVPTSDRGVTEGSLYYVWTMTKDGQLRLHKFRPSPGGRQPFGAVEIWDAVERTSRCASCGRTMRRVGSFDINL